MMFIKLTMYQPYKPEDVAVWVNAAHITYLFEQTGERYEKRTDNPNAQRVVRTVTIVSFPAGLHEESDSINVTESVEEIMLRIHAWENLK